MQKLVDELPLAGSALKRSRNSPVIFLHANKLMASNGFIDFAIPPILGRGVALRPEGVTVLIVLFGRSTYVEYYQEVVKTPNWRSPKGIYDVLFNKELMAIDGIF